MDPLLEQVKLGISSALNERRRNERLPTAVPLRLRRFEVVRPRAALCTDISEGGIGVDTAESLGVGEVVEIEFVEADRVLTARCRVMYRQMQHYGLAFLGAAKVEAS